MITSQANPSPFRWLKFALLVAVLLTLVLVVVGLTSFFRLSRDARCLRNSLIAAAELRQLPWKHRLEFSVGPISFFALRLGLSWAPLEPEARSALRAIRRAEVGIYELSSSAEHLDHWAKLAEADEAMTRRGWERLVGVSTERECVAVYVPKAGGSGAQVQACVAVLHGRQLIVASTRTDLEPLLELASNRPELRRQNWLPAQL